MLMKPDQAQKLYDLILVRENICESKEEELNISGKPRGL
jgi:hypothetical protein